MIPPAMTPGILTNTILWIADAQMILLDNKRRLIARMLPAEWTHPNAKQEELIQVIPAAQIREQELPAEA